MQTPCGGTCDTRILRRIRHVVNNAVLVVFSQEVLFGAVVYVAKPCVFEVSLLCYSFFCAGKGRCEVEPRGGSSSRAPCGDSQWQACGRGRPRCIRCQKGVWRNRRLNKPHGHESITWTDVCCACCRVVKTWRLWRGLVERAPSHEVSQRLPPCAARSVKTAIMSGNLGGVCRQRAASHQTLSMR